jgi:very-short-patch-repair endonuclease/predicted transcriptional regulator of viral defense system
MGGQGRTADEILARLGGRGHGVVTRREVLAAGLSERQVDRRIGRGALIVVHPGVYRVGHRAPSLEARYLAAVKAAGEGAVLSGLAAAYLFGLVKGTAPAPVVSAPRERRIKGVRVRRVRRLGEEVKTVWRGIPVTTVPRTLIDLSSLLSFDELAKAAHEATIRYEITTVERAPQRLRAILEGDAPVLLSRLERRFRALLRAAGLPLPITNRPAGAHYVDCRWPEHKLTVELDSYHFHKTRHAWEQDRRRDREARRRGDLMRRYTWRDVFEEPADMLTELRELLADRSR